MDTVIDFLSQITQAAFVLLGLISLTDYLRHRGPVRRDIALMFASLAITVGLQLVSSLIPDAQPVLGPVGSFVIVTQPFFLLRLVRYFRPVQRVAHIGATAGMIASWLVLLIPAESRPSVFTVAIIMYFVVVDGYAMLGFVQSAIRTSGIVQQRMRFAGAGSGLLALALFWSALAIVVPSSSAITPLLTQLTAIIAAISFYLGLAAPQWLRRTWQLDELRKFLLDIRQAGPLETQVEVYDMLGGAILKVTGATSVSVAVSDDATGRWLIHQPNRADMIAASDTSNFFQEQLEQQSSKAIFASELLTAIREDIQAQNAGLAYLVPLTSERRAWGCIFTYLEHGALFADDDLQMIELFADQAALVLENIDLIGSLRQYAEGLEERVHDRTAELMRRNTHINLLQQITVAANEATDIDTPIRDAILLICETLEFPIGHAFAPDEVHLESLKSTAIWYLNPPENYESFKIATELTAFDTEWGGVGKALSEATPQWYTNITERSEFVRADVARETGLKTGIFVPVLSRNEPVAVLEFYSDKVIKADKDILDILAQIGTQLGRIIERNRAAASIRESEQRFSLIANAAPIPLVISRIADGKVLYANDASTVLHGVSVEEFVGQKAADLYANPADRQALVNELSTQGFVQGFELQVRRLKDRKLFWASATIRPITFEGHEALFSTFIDVTETKEAQAALVESEERFRNAFDLAAVGRAITNPEGQFLEVNESFCNLLGYEEASLFEKTWMDITNAEHMPGVAEQVQKLLDGNAPSFRMELQLLPRGANPRWIDLNVVIIRNMLGDPIHLIGDIVDIDERKQAEEAVRQSEDRFRRAVLNAPLPCIIHAEDGEIILINKTWTQLTGYTLDDIPTIADWTEKAYGERMEPVRVVIEKLFEADDVTHEGEFEITVHDGRRLIWDFSSTLLGYLPDGRRMILSMASDVTQRKQIETKIRQLNTELEQRVRDRTAHLTAVNKELEAFSYSVSHDLRAPLRAVDGFGQALLEDYNDLLDDMGRDFLNRIRRESQRMGVLIDDLIALSRITRAEVELSPVNLSQLVTEIASELQAGEPDRDVIFNIQGDITTCGDESLLRVALQNLISNAWKFTSKKSQAHIEFGCTHEEGHIEFYLRDNGAGFEMAYANKLFGAFQRLHKMDEFEGTGIGLATVQRIMHRHGGSVRAEGALDKGATFYFTLAEGACN